jgi:hypothetical protein
MIKPFFAELDIPFDRDAIHKEIASLLQLSLETGPHKKFKEHFAPNIDITYFDETGIKPGSVQGYRVLSLTVSQQEHAEFGFNFLRHTMKEHEWQWRDGLEKTRQFVDSLPFSEYYIVKLIYLPAGGVGVTHSDSNYGEQTDSISIQISDGGTKLQIFTDDGVIEPEVGCFIFDDSFLHGTGTAHTDRIVLRVHGKFRDDIDTFYRPNRVFYKS